MIEEQGGRRPTAGEVAGQALAVYLLATALVALCGWLLLVGAWAGPAGYLLIPVALAAGFGALAGLARGNRRARAGWAATVLAGGLVPVIAAVAVVQQVGTDLPVTSALTEPAAAALLGLPSALVCLLLAPSRGRRYVVAAVVLLAAVTVIPVGVLIQQQAAARDREARVAAAGGPRELLYLTRIPGYRLATLLVSGQNAYTPMDQGSAASWGSDDILVTVSKVPVSGPDCGPGPIQAPAPAPGQASAPTPSPIRCRPDGPSLLYRSAADRHEYVRLDGDVVIRADARLGVRQDLLRSAVTAARPLTDSEIDKYLPAATGHAG